MQTTTTEKITMLHMNYVQAVTEHIKNYKEWFGTDWPHPISPSIEFFEHLMYAHTQDVCERALVNNLRIHGAHHYIEGFLEDNYPHITLAEQKAVLVEYMTLIGADWQNELVKHIGIDGFQVWQPSLKNNLTILENYGDYRILEWEREHLIEGTYVPDAITATNAETKEVSDLYTELNPAY